MAIAIPVSMSLEPATESVAVAHCVTASLMLGVATFSAIELTFGSAPGALEAVRWRPVAWLRNVLLASGGLHRRHDCAITCERGSRTSFGRSFAHVCNLNNVHGLRRLDDSASRCNFSTHGKGNCVGFADVGGLDRSVKPPYAMRTTEQLALEFN